MKTAVIETDEERKLHNTWVLEGTVLNESEDAKGHRLITRDGKVFAWNERLNRYCEVSILAKYWKE